MKCERCHQYVVPLLGEKLEPGILSIMQAEITGTSFKATEEDLFELAMICIYEAGLSLTPLSQKGMEESFDFSQTKKSEDLKASFRWAQKQAKILLALSMKLAEHNLGQYGNTSMFVLSFFKKFLR